MVGYENLEVWKRSMGIVMEQMQNILKYSEKKYY